MPLDPRRQVVRYRDNRRDVDSVRVVPAALAQGLSLVRADALGTPGQQGDGTAGVAPVRVRQSDRDLGQSLPQVTLAGRA